VHQSCRASREKNPSLPALSRVLLDTPRGTAENRPASEVVLNKGTLTQPLWEKHELFNFIRFQWWLFNLRGRPRNLRAHAVKEKKKKEKEKKKKEKKERKGKREATNPLSGVRR
jgi:hypothetical protein